MACHKGGCTNCPSHLVAKHIHQATPAGRGRRRRPLRLLPPQVHVAQVILHARRVGLAGAGA